MIIRDLVTRNAALYGRNPAFLCEGRTVTHEAFAARVFALANALLASGAQPQSRVAILSRNRIESLEIMYATACAGLISVSLNWRLAVPELIRIVQDCEPDILIFERAFSEAAAPIAQARPALRCVAIDPEERAADVDGYDRLVASGSSDPPTVQIPEEWIESLVYTSGTTGEPKGVMLSQRAIIGAALASSWEGDVSGDDRVLIVMPLFHVGGKIEQMAFWVAGATTCLNARFEAEDVLLQIERDRITAAHLAPTMIAMLLDEPGFRRERCQSLRLIHYASAPMPEPLLRKAIGAFGRIFVQVYGMTECVLGTVLKAHQHVLDGDAERRARLLSAGQPYVGVEVRIEDPEGRSCVTGAAGEILLNGVALMSGYWNRTSLTIDTLRGGWMRTGDIGYLDRDGFLFIVDRKKDMIISGGENVYSREVEEALASHHAVREAAVVGAPDPIWGESVFAFVALVQDAQISAEDLIAHCRERIASYKKPRSIRFIESLPRIHNGKIDKKELRVLARESLGLDPA